MKFLFISFALILHLSFKTNALIESFSYESDEKAIQFDLFGYLKNGTIDMNIQVSGDSSNINYVVCSYSELKTTKIDQQKLCHNLFDEQSLHCIINEQIINNTYSGFYRITKKDHYFFFVTNCQSTGNHKYTFDYTLMNPNGEYLSTDYIPLPVVYLIFIFIWIVFMILWIFNWIRHRKTKINLHRLLSFTLFIMTINLIGQFLYWRILSTKGKISINIFAGILLTDALSQFLFYISLLFIARGWSIIHPELDGQSARYSFTIVFCLVIFSELLAATSGFFATLFFFLWLIAYFYLLRRLFRTTNENQTMLKNQLILIRDMDINPTTTPIYEKYVLFRKFKKAITIYLFLQILIYFIGSLFLYFSPWITELLFLIASTILSFGVGFTFRLKSFHSLFNDLPNTGYSNLENQNNSQNEANEAELIGPNLRTWDGEIELSTLLKNKQMEVDLTNESMILVQNPQEDDHIAEIDIAIQSNFEDSKTKN
ncbi:hypothetical protein M0811_11213 [Anaeramoeba ignava]|uniref:GOST seven transmembrane domain-containing protein n=1 Tax=Anaeramoeba ignava TaxID=1746090 RepID=A0A9Q0R8Y7_ANAIG|nr:hypothetical protein M0811_11213 [Anaeramoeba ignava]